MASAGQASAASGAGSAFGSIIGGLMGAAASAGDYQKASDAIDHAQRIIDSVGAPPDLSSKIYYDQLKQAGVINPQNEQAIQQGITFYANIKQDDKLRNSQIDALAQYTQMSHGGLRPEDRAKFNQLKQEAATETEGKMQQIGQNFAQRGQAGGGNELAASLMAAQQGANRLSSGGDQIAATASQNALNALGQQASLSGQVRGQDYQQQADIAAAKDRIAQFNAQNSAATQQRNVAGQNQAQYANLANTQQISNANTQQANTEMLRQKNAQEQQWQDQLKLAKAQADISLRTSPMYNAQGEAKAEQKQELGTGIGGLIGSGAQIAMLSDIRSKENIKSADNNVEDMLDKLTGYHYNYKEDPNKEEHTGIIAQDLEKSKPGKELVEETPKGKVVDFNKAGGTIFAALANINKRLKELES